MGEKIAKLLEEHGMTQRELAEKVGVTEVSMSRYIKGERIPKAPLIAKIAEALHTSANYLVGIEEKEDPEMDFYFVKRTIIKNANGWSNKQKASIVLALFDC